MQSLPGTQNIDIDEVDQAAVKTYIRDIALLTMTNAEDWNFRFIPVGSCRNPYDVEVIHFHHPAATSFVSPLVDFAFSFDVEEERQGDLTTG